MYIVRQRERERETEREKTRNRMKINVKVYRQKVNRSNWILHLLSSFYNFFGWIFTITSYHWMWVKFLAHLYLEIVFQSLWICVRVYSEDYTQVLTRFLAKCLDTYKMREHLYASNSMPLKWLSLFSFHFFPAAFCLNTYFTHKAFIPDMWVSDFLLIDDVCVCVISVKKQQHWTWKTLTNRYLIRSNPWADMMSIVITIVYCIAALSKTIAFLLPFVWLCMDYYQDNELCCLVFD